MSVSVVIPAYNAETFIRRAIDSVLQQTAPADEILVIDDGSKDATPRVVESYGGRVRLIVQQNQGPSAARNLGVQSTHSDWIAFLDADDAWRPDKVEKQLAALAAAPGSVLCYTSLLMIHPDGSESVSPAAPARTVHAALRLGNPGITPSSVMVARSAFLEAGGFSNRFKGSEDWDFWITLRGIGPFCAVEEPVTLYTANNTGLSSNAAHMLNEAERILETRLLPGLSGVSRVAYRRRFLSYQNYKAALTARASEQQRSSELRYLLDSFRLWPSPFWFPHRFKALAVTARHRLQKQSTH